MSNKLTDEQLTAYKTRFSDWHPVGKDDCAICAVRRLLDHIAALEEELKAAQEENRRLHRALSELESE